MFLTGLLARDAHRLLIGLWKQQKGENGVFLSFPSQQSSEIILEEITEEKLLQGYTIGYALNFKILGLSVSISQFGKRNFGPVSDLSSLGDMDGSTDLYDDDDGRFASTFFFFKTMPLLSAYKGDFCPTIHDIHQQLVMTSLLS